MQGVTDDRSSWALRLRWTARYWSVTSISLILAFIVVERDNPSYLNQWVGFLLFPFGISAGMVVAWWREGLGGAITVACLAAFYLYRFAITGAFPAGWAWLVFAAPGFLFLLAWSLSRRSTDERR